MRAVSIADRLKALKANSLVIGNDLIIPVPYVLEALSLVPFELKFFMKWVHERGVYSELPITTIPDKPDEWVVKWTNALSNNPLFL